MNDALRTNVFVRFSPETVAAACIYLAARVKRVPLPNRPNWFTVFGMREEDLRDIASSIMKLYTRAKVGNDDTHMLGRVPAWVRGLKPPIFAMSSQCEV